jgi:hypothetical protein
VEEKGLGFQYVPRSSRSQVFLVFEKPAKIEQKKPRKTGVE